MSSRQLSYYNESVSARPSTQSNTSSAIFVHDYVITPSHLNANSPTTTTHAWSLTSSPPYTYQAKERVHFHRRHLYSTRLHGGITVTYIITTHSFPTHAWGLTSTPPTPIKIKNFTRTGAIFNLPNYTVARTHPLRPSWPFDF